MAVGLAAALPINRTLFPEHGKMGHGFWATRLGDGNTSWGQNSQRMPLAHGPGDALPRVPLK